MWVYYLLYVLKNLIITYIAHLYAISFDKIVFPIPGAPLIKTLQGGCWCLQMAQRFQIYFCKFALCQVFSWGFLVGIAKVLTSIIHYFSTFLDTSNSQDFSFISWLPMVNYRNTGEMLWLLWWPIMFGCFISCLLIYDFNMISNRSWFIS